jgi:general secretion pathway protein D
LPDDLELGALVDLVSQQLGINFIIGDELRGKRITLKAPAQIPQSSLYGLLESVLRSQGLVVVDAKQENWKLIVQTRDLARISEVHRDEKAITSEQGVPITQVFLLKNADPQNVDKIIRPFLTEKGSNVVSVPEHQFLIVTDFSSNVKRVASIIDLLDQPNPTIQVKFVPIKHIKASDAARELTELLATKNKATGFPAGTDPKGKVDIASDDRTNQVIFVGTSSLISEAQQFLSSFDTPLDVTTKAYRMAAISPDRIDKLIRDLLPKADIDRTYRSVIDKESGLLIVTTTPEYHHQIADLQSSLDVPLVEVQNPVRFYKLQNANSREVLEVIQSLESHAGFSSVKMDSSPNSETKAAAEPTTLTPTSGTVPSNNPLMVGQNLSLPTPNNMPVKSSSKQKLTALSSELLAQPKSVLDQTEASVTADANTNSIIVIAEPRVQQIYESLIQKLDQRRPQVLIEVTLVTVDTSNGFSLGIEIAGRGHSGATDFITFSQFGLSDITPPGSLTLTPGIGFNGAIVNANIADIIIHALKTNAHSKVISAPRLLVNDNATGTLASIAESPVQSVNASDTVATTSFAGFVAAGTTITLTPRISQGDHLLLDYDFSLNAFTGEATDNLPPPRQTNSIQSSVTIPDGYTIIVGGLTRSDHSRTRSSVPFLGDIPILGELFASSKLTDAKTTLFVFIRPIILRDDKFKDLKYLSDQNLARAELPSNFPNSAPMLMH